MEDHKSGSSKSKSMAYWTHNRYLKAEKVRAWLGCFEAGTARCKANPIGDDGNILYEFWAPREWTAKERIWMGSKDMEKAIQVNGEVITGSSR